MLAHSSGVLILQSSMNFLKSLALVVLVALSPIWLASCASEGPGRSVTSSLTEVSPVEFWTLGPNEFQRKIDILTCEKMDEIVSGVFDGYELQPSRRGDGDRTSEVSSCVWESGEGGRVLIGIDQTKADAEYIREMRGQDFFGELPRSEIHRSARLDGIGAVATLPENTRTSARVWIPGLRVETVTSISRDTALEASTRIAEYLVSNNMLPPDNS